MSEWFDRNRWWLTLLAVVLSLTACGISLFDLLFNIPECWNYIGGC